MVTIENSPKRIVSTKRQEDGTTLGKRVYTDDLGGKWINSPTPNACQTTINNLRVIDRNGFFIITSTVT